MCSSDLVIITDLVIFLLYLMVGCLGVAKLRNLGNLLSSCNIMFHLIFFVWKIKGFLFSVGHILSVNIRNYFGCSYGLARESPYTLKPLPEGVPVPMCYCGDPCKVDVSEDDETYQQRYWMCSNFAWEPTEKQRRSMLCVSNLLLCINRGVIILSFSLVICFVTIICVADPSTAV